MQSKQYLSPTQKKVKKPRRCIYSGPHKNTDSDVAKDILSLYVTCKLGYSPICHILGLKKHKKIEDVIRQHMLGRKGVDGSIGELYCPSSKELEEQYIPIIKNLISQYNTQNDPYIVEMLNTGKWYDDSYPAKCSSCGSELKGDWVACPFCGKSKTGKIQKQLF